MVFFPFVCSGRSIDSIKKWFNYEWLRLGFPGWEKSDSLKFYAGVILMIYEKLHGFFMRSYMVDFVSRKNLQS